MAETWQKPPWWVWATGALFAVCAVAVFSAQLSGPVGWELRRTADADRGVGALVVLTRQGSPAATAGLQAGDWLTARDLQRFIQTLRAGRDFQFDVERAGEPRTLVLTLSRKDWSFWRSSQGFQLLLAVAATALCLVLAAVLVYMRSEDRVARWGALLLAEIAIVGGVLGPGLNWPELAAAVLSLPGPLTVAALVGLALSNTLPATALTLLGTFPAPPVRGRRLALLWLPALITIPLAVSVQWTPVYGMASGPVMPTWLNGLAYLAGAVYLTTAMALLWRNYLRLTDPNHRRRVQVLVVGLTISAAAVLIKLGVGALWWLTSADRIWPAPAQYAPWFTSVPYMAAPVCVAYAILRHRMFDIRVMIRLGLRYAAARGVLLSLVPLSGLALVADVLARGNQPLFTILRTRGWLYAGLAVGALLLHARQRTWLQALDRRFFRERYDAQRILSGVVEDVGRCHDFDDAAARAVSAIDGALHPQFALVTVREDGGPAHPAASCGDAPPPLADGKLMALVRALERPVEVVPGETGWVLRQLPPDEADAVRASRVEWLFPVALAPRQPEALLVLGPKRSEEPYSAEDQELLHALAGSLAFMLARATAPGPDAAPGFEECPACGVCYDPGHGTCARDGDQLARVWHPRTVASRYRLDRRLGRGGMGIVYEGFDTELGRRVALKLMRPEVFTGADALGRFRAEAKTAAAFSHPNVVVIHDFGVETDGRAYLVMELLDGSTLREMLARNGRLEPARAARALGGVSNAVGAAHERSLLHRDLKPENIFLTSAGGGEVAKVFDFGIVKRLAGDGQTETSSSDTAPGLLVGTRRYMAPEQLAGGPPRISWDLWALAVVAYETLMGVHPFREAGGLPAWPLPEADLQGAPSAWRAFFTTALAPDPERRPASAAAFDAALQAALAVEG